MSARHCLFFLILNVSGISGAVAQQISAPEPQTGTIVGTVTDVNGGTVPGAGVALERTSLGDARRVETNNNGFFQLDHVNPGIPYHVTVSASGLANWTSPEVILRPGQYLELTGIRLGIAAAVTTVKAVVSTEEIAREQEKVEEQQRVLGFIPNFYVVYDSNAVPLTPKLKFRLALKTSTDPITFVGSAFLAGLDQAADVHSYGQGAKGYGQRFWRHLCHRCDGHHDRRGYPAFHPASGSALLLPGRGHKQVARTPRHLQPIHLQGRQRPFAAQLFESGRLSGLWRHRQRLLSCVGSRPGACAFDGLD